MPVGSALAKASISTSIKKRAARAGPLSIMTKVGAQEAPYTTGRLSAGLKPDGEVMKLKQSSCNDDQVGWQAQDHTGDPLEKARPGR
ncbi:MAG: hypothetical protein AAFQ58_18625 [Pseudomonadota bacterium]